MTPQEPEAEAPGEIQGLVDELDGGRSVWVGQVPGDSHVYVVMRNGEDATKFKLSFEAAQSLRELLGRTSERGLMAHATWTVVTVKAELKEQDA